MLGRFFLCLALLSASAPEAQAAAIVSEITGHLLSVTGQQAPVAIRVGDQFTISLRYVNVGNSYTLVFPGGSSQIATEPLTGGRLFLTDAAASFSNNLLQVFSEFSGSNGYGFNSSIITDISNGAERLYTSRIYPSATLIFTWSPQWQQNYISSGGYMILTAAGQTSTTLQFSYSWTNQLAPPASLNGGAGTALVLLITALSLIRRYSRRNWNEEGQSCETR